MLFAHQYTMHTHSHSMGWCRGRIRVLGTGDHVVRDIIMITNFVIYSSNIIVPNNSSNAIKSRITT